MMTPQFFQHFFITITSREGCTPIDTTSIQMANKDTFAPSLSTTVRSAKAEKSFPPQRKKIGPSPMGAWRSKQHFPPNSVLDTRVG